MPSIRSHPPRLLALIRELYELAAAAIGPPRWSRRYFGRMLRKDPLRALESHEVSRRIALLRKLSLVEERDGNWLGAERCLRELLDLRPNDTSALISLASVLEKQGNQEGARAIYASLSSRDDVRSEHRAQAAREVIRLA